MPRSTPAAIKRPIFTPSSIPTSVAVHRETSLMGSIKEGFGLGVGMSVARSLFGGGAPVQHQPQKSEPTEFERCIAEHKDDVAVCAHLAQKK